GFMLALALLAAAPVSFLMFMMALGVRPDVMTAMHNPFFDLKFVVTLALAIPAMVVGLRLGEPAPPPGRRPWLLALPVVIVVLGIVAEASEPQRLSWSTR